MALSEQLLSELRGILGAANVLTSAEDLIPYSFDGTAALQAMPGAVVFVTTTRAGFGNAEMGQPHAHRHRHARLGHRIERRQPAVHWIAS